MCSRDLHIYFTYFSNSLKLQNDFFPIIWNFKMTFFLNFLKSQKWFFQFVETSKWLFFFNFLNLQNNFAQFLKLPNDSFFGSFSFIISWSPMKQQSTLLSKSTGMILVFMKLKRHMNLLNIEEIPLKIMPVALLEKSNHSAILFWVVSIKLWSLFRNATRLVDS